MLCSQNRGAELPQDHCLQHRAAAWSALNTECSSCPHGQARYREPRASLQLLFQRLVLQPLQCLSG